MLLKPTSLIRVTSGQCRFSTLYRVDAIEAIITDGRTTAYATGFSTLYRVDAIEAFAQEVQQVAHLFVSVPSIGSMLLKPLGGG